MTIKRFIAFALVIGFASLALSQDIWDMTRTTINNMPVVIEYGRPLLKGRRVADLLKQLPPDRIWRAGSGPATTLVVGTDLLIGGKKIAAGSYSLYMYCPENGDYALVVNKEVGEIQGMWLPKAAQDRSNRPYPHSMNYAEIANKEVARIPLKRIEPEKKTEVLMYNFETAENITLLTISWGDQAWTVEFQSAANK